MKKIAVMVVLGFGLTIGANSVAGAKFQCVSYFYDIGICDLLPGVGGLCCISCTCNVIPFLDCDCSTSIPENE